MPSVNRTTCRSLLRPKATTGPALAHQPGPTIPLPCSLDAQELHAFDHFRQRTAGQLAGHFASAIWEYLVLQVSHQQPAVMHAAIAVGSLYQSRQATALVSGVSGLENSSYRQAVTHYSKAIVKLRAYMEGANGENREEITTTVLIACLLFISFEMLQGDQKLVISHLVKGLKILFEYCRPKIPIHMHKRGVVVRNSTPEPIDRLSEVFVRLDADSTMFGRRAPFLHPINYYQDMGPAIQVPPFFESVNEARIQLDRLASIAFCIRGELVKIAEESLPKTNGTTTDWHVYYCTLYARARRIDHGQHPHLASRKHELLKAFGTWQSSLAAMGRPKDSTAILLLQIQQLFPWFIISTFQERRVSLSDRFEAEFVRTIDLATKYVEKTRSESSQFAFIMEPGILSSLYLVGTKCRSLAVRRKAIELLSRATLQEGLWSGRLYGKFVQRLMEVEEQRTRELIGAEADLDYLPEEARFSDVVFGVDPEKPGYGRLVCARSVHESSDDLEIVEDTFLLSS